MNNKAIKRDDLKLVRIIGILLIVSVAVIILATTKTKASGEDNILASKRAYYRELEKTYETVLRDVLNRKGYVNAGITITSVIEIDGSREYSVSIHHRKFADYDEAQLNQFLEDISELTFTDNETKITYSIL